MLEQQPEPMLEPEPGLEPNFSGDRTRHVTNEQVVCENEKCSTRESPEGESFKIKR